MRVVGTKGYALALTNKMRHREGDWELVFWSPFVWECDMAYIEGSGPRYPFSQNIDGAIMPHLSGNVVIQFRDMQAFAIMKVNVLEQLIWQNYWEEKARQRRQYAIEDAIMSGTIIFAVPFIIYLFLKLLYLIGAK